MTDRQEVILNSIIREYSKSARPVGSGWLSDRGNFGIKPAMIRQEMAALEGEGYLMQPHTSAGRVPTDKAYRWFISEEVLDETSSTLLSRAEQEKIKTALAASDDIGALLHALSRAVAEIAHGISVTGLANRRLFFTAGFTELLEEPEIEDSAYVRTLMQLVESINEQTEHIWEALFSKDIQILVGRENPFRYGDNFSLVTREYMVTLPNNNGASQQAFISIIGPRRMDYKKNVALVKYICKILQE